MEYEYINNNVTGACDLLMHIGTTYYNVPEILAEGRGWGISKRIPLNSIPDGFVPYASRLFGWHSEAIPMVMSETYTLVDLVSELLERGLLDADYQPQDFGNYAPTALLLPDDYVPPAMLRVTVAIQKDKQARAELEAKYQIQWQGGVIFATLLGPVQMVVGSADEELPTELQHDKRIVAVYVEQYVDQDGTPIERHGDDVEDED